ncbi:MAG: hypothetical protein QOI95_1077 [Acidimicrobiaceae bacterium]|jgi:hypothetical protein
MAKAKTPPTERETATAALDLCIRAANAYHRDDLGERLARARERLVDPLFHVLVVGEFKQGKSSLINALLGVDVCPVDDDIATAVPTKLHYAPKPEASASVSPASDAPEGTASTTEPVPFDQVSQYVTEAANPENVRHIESVDVGVPAALLQGGLVLVDTPGVGGLGSTHSTITIGALPMADAVLFVSDASQEYSGPELEFMRTARSLCPNVGCVMTKIDFYPAWRKILDLDLGHLADAGLTAPILPISSTLRRVAAETGDASVEEESGFAQLESYLSTEIVGQRELLVVRTAAAEMLSAIAQLESQFSSERTALADPERAGNLVHQLQIATEQSDRLRSTASRWQLTLNDGFTDLLTDVDHDLRARLRQLTKDADNAIDQSDPAESWEEFEPWLYRQASDHVVANYTMLQRRAGEIAARVAELFSADGHDIAVQLDVLNPAELLKAVEASADVELQEGDGLSTGMSTLRSSYGGALMFGMFGQMVGLALINPVGVVAGIIFGGKAYRDEKNRALAQRRSQAKNAHRKYTDELAFEVGKDARDTVRRIQRQLRDQFTARAEELYRSTTEALHKAQQAIEIDAKTRTKRLPDVEAELTRIRALRTEVAAIAPDLAGTS